MWSIVKTQQQPRNRVYQHPLFLFSVPVYRVIDHETFIKNSDWVNDSGCRHIEPQTTSLPVMCLSINLGSFGRQISAKRTLQGASCLKISNSRILTPATTPSPDTRCLQIPFDDKWLSQLRFPAPHTNCPPTALSSIKKAIYFLL